jgi:enoyl-CoA hydratase
MTDSPLLLHREADVCRLTLNRPQQGNALSRELVDALDAALDMCAINAPASLVIDGAGRHFCTGFDLSGLANETDDSLLARFTRIELLLQRVARAPFHTVAVAHGRVMGAGADLFAACAERVAVSGARFAFPGWRGFGLVLGSRRLASRVGAHRASEWIESGCVTDDADALASGLATARVDFSPGAFAAPAANELDSALASAIAGNAQLDDASDLAALVRSAACAGLHQRLTVYVEQQARDRLASAIR